MPLQHSGYWRLMWVLNGAGDRFRTDDLVLGKHTLYQLSYTRSLWVEY
jgi:hypothetical protein